jgi:glycerophosphoryl diester phosphodiesterase
MLQHALVTPQAVERAHALDAAVVAWTVDATQDVERVVAAGVDGIVSNDPAKLLATLAA